MNKTRNDHLTDHPTGRNPDTLVQILRALYPQSGVPIQHVSRKLWSSPEFESIGARILYMTVGTGSPSSLVWASPDVIDHYRRQGQLSYYTPISRTAAAAPIG
jgi:hypothetical protein